MQEVRDRPLVNRYTLNIHELEDCALFANTNPYYDGLKQAYRNSRYTFIADDGTRRSGDTMGFSEQELQDYEEYEIEQKHAKQACKNIIRFFTPVNYSPADIYGNDQNKLKQFAANMQDYADFVYDKDKFLELSLKNAILFDKNDIYQDIYDKLFLLITPLDKIKIADTLLDTPVKTSTSFLQEDSNEMMRAANNFQEIYGNYISPSFQYLGFIKNIEYLGPKIGEIQTRQDGTIEDYNSFCTIYLRGYDVNGLTSNEEREEYKRYLHQEYLDELLYLYAKGDISNFLYNPIKYCDSYDGACHSNSDNDIYYEAFGNATPNDPLYIGIDIEFTEKF